MVQDKRDEGQGNGQSSALESAVSSVQEQVGPEPDTQQGQQAGPTLLPVEEYVSMFSRRYAEEEWFRGSVHNYLKLSAVRRLGLAATNNFLLHGLYARQTAGLVREYAALIRHQTENAIQFAKHAAELREAERVLLESSGQLEGVSDLRQRAEHEYMRLRGEKEAAVAEVGSKYNAQIAQTEEAARRAREAIVANTDAAGIARELVVQNIKSSGLVRESGGTLTFDEQMLTRRLEDIFLDEIIYGIEKESGRGFMAEVMQGYSGVVSRLAELEDISELPEADWIESAIYSRTKGYRLPTVPFIIVPKYEGKSRGRSSIDTAIIVDTSGSTEKNQRFEIEQKTAMALHALMRRLNPDNHTCLAHYNYSVEQISTEQLRHVSPNGATATDLALEWLLETLKDSGPSMAYLLTDGRPEGNGDIIGRTVKAAARFQQYPQVLLRIFLIDGDAETEGIMRKVGLAAGTATKLMPVKNYELAGGLIRDVPGLFRQMYAIAEF